MNERKNSVSDHNAVLQGYTGPGTTWTNEMKFGLNHTSGAVKRASTVHGRPLDGLERQEYQVLVIIFIKYINQATMEKVKRDAHEGIVLSRHCVEDENRLELPFTALVLSRHIMLL